MQTATPVEHPSSPLVRTALLAYTCLILYASLYPFSGWRRTGASPLTYLTERFPHYWTVFDVSIDIVGYIPFGILLVLACYPWLTRVWASMLSMLLGAMMTGSMEAIQTYLPTRVASILDFVTNCLGLLIGIILGSLLTPLLLEKDLLKRIRQRWFITNASRGLMLVALWPFAQIYPQGYLFGLGHVVPALSNWFSKLLDMPVDLGSILRQGAELSVEQYWLSETLITCCGLIGAVLIFLCLLQRNAPKARLVSLLIISTLGLKSLSQALLFKPENAWTWITPGVEAGLIVGCMMLYGLAFTPAKAQRHLAMFMLAISVLVINVVPGNPYFTDTMSGWVQGKFLNFNGAAQFLSILWPWMALWFLANSKIDKASGFA